MKHSPSYINYTTSALRDKERTQRLGMYRLYRDLDMDWARDWKELGEATATDVRADVARNVRYARQWHRLAMQMRTMKGLLQ